MGEPAFTLTKLENRDVRATLIAERNMAAGDQEEDWQEVARRDWNFGSYNYGIWFEDLRGGDHTWVFGDETLTVNTENLDGLPEDSFEIKWQVGVWKEENDEIESDAQYYTVHEKTEDGISGSSITLHGDKMLYENGVNVRAIVMAGDQEVSRTDTHVYGKKASYDYQWPCQEPGENEYLVCDSAWISNEVSCYVENQEYPWGENIPLTGELKEVRQYQWNDEAGKWVEAADETVAKLDTRENGWNLDSQDYGRVDLVLSCASLAEEGKTKDYVLEIYFNDVSYDLSRYYPYGTDQMLPESAMEIGTSLSQSWRYREDRGGREITDYRLELQRDGEGNLCYDTNLVTAEIEKDGKTLIVKANKDTGGCNIPVVILVRELDENGDGVSDEEGNPCYYEAGVRNFWVNVTGEYYYIFPQELTEEGGASIQVNLGGSLDLSGCKFSLYRVWREETDGEETAEGGVLETGDIRFFLTDWDNNAWDVKEGTEENRIPTLVRMKPWQTGFSIVAEKNFAGEDKEENWQEVARQSYDIGELDAELEIDYRYSDPDRDGRIFVEMPQQITVNTEKLDGMMEGDYEIVWEVNGQKADSAENNVSGTVSGGHGETLTLTASRDHLNEWVQVHAAVLLKGEEISGRDMELQVVQEDAWYNQLPDADQWLLKGWDMNFGNRTNCWIQDMAHPYGEELGMTITDVSLNVTEGAAQCIQLTPWEDEEGWNIYVHNPGEAKGTVEYVLDDGTEGTYEFVIHVGGEVYYMDIAPDTGTDQVLPGGSLNLNADLLAFGMTVEWKWNVEWQDGSQEGTSDNDPITLTPGADGISAEVSAAADAADCDICVNVTAWLPDEAQEEGRGRIADGQFRLYVRNGYYQLVNVSADEEGEEIREPLSMSERMGMGETAEMKPALLWRDKDQDGNPQETAVKNVHYRWEWDEDAVEITYRPVDSGTGSGGDGAEDQSWLPMPKNEEGGCENVAASAFRLRRTGDWGTDLRLIAELPDENGEYQEVSSYGWRLDDLNYGVWFENLREGGRTWVFEDETYELVLNTGNLEGLENVRLVWQAGAADEKGEFTKTIGEDAGFTVEKDQKSVILEGALLKESDIIKNGDEILVRVEVYVTGQENPVEIQDAWVSICENEEHIEDEEQVEILQTARFYYDGGQIRYSIKNKDYPWGQDFELPIETITVVNGRYDEELGQVVEDTETEAEPVLVCGREDGLWYLEASSPGLALVTYTLKGNEELKEETITVTRMKFVATQMYILKLGMSTGSGCLLPGDSLTLDTAFREASYNPETGEREHREVTDYMLAYSEYKQNLISVDENGVVTALEGAEDGETSICVTALIPAVDEDGNPVTGEDGEEAWMTAAQEWVDICVSADYKQLTVNAAQAHQGDTISVDDLAAKLLHYTSESPEGQELEDKDVELYFDYTELEGRAFHFSEDRRKVTIHPEVVTADDSIWNTGLTIDAVYTNVYGDREVYSGWLELTVTFQCRGHQPQAGSEKVIREASCSQKGITEYICGICKETYQVETPKAADKHNYTVTTKNPTCTAAGTRTYTCTDCGHSYSEAYGAPSGHREGSWTTTAWATCTTAGAQVQKCTVCGAVLGTKTLAATGHKWSAWIVSANATVFAAQQQKRTCSLCGAAETRSVGSRLTAVLELPGKLTSLNIKKDNTVKCTLTMANGDTVTSVKSGNAKYVKVASYDKKGNISLKAVKTGSAKLTIRLASGRTRTYTVKVTSGTVKTTKVTVTPASITLAKGKSQTLKPVLTPFTSTQKAAYKSADKKVAKVTSSGKITAVAPGKTTVTVTSGSKKAKVNVTVTGIGNVKSSVTVKRNKTLTLKPKLYGISGKVTYTSSNKAVAAVAANGRIKGIKKGTAIITIKAGSYSVKCKVKVN